MLNHKPISEWSREKSHHAVFLLFSQRQCSSGLQEKIRDIWVSFTCSASKVFVLVWNLGVAHMSVDFEWLQNPTGNLTLGVAPTINSRPHPNRCWLAVSFDTTECSEKPDLLRDFTERKPLSPNLVTGWAAESWETLWATHSLDGLKLVWATNSYCGLPKTKYVILPWTIYHK